MIYNYFSHFIGGAIWLPHPVESFLLSLIIFRFLRVHEGPVTGLSLHATGDYILSTSTDQHWAFSDIRTGKLIAKVTDGENGQGPALTCAQFHPDGLIFGTGTSDAIIKIWDLKEVSKTIFII